MLDIFRSFQVFWNIKLMKW